MSRGRRISRLKLIVPSADHQGKYLLEWSAKQLREDIRECPKLISRLLFASKDAPLNVEIGSGSGEYLCYLAKENPSENYLGIEASKKAAYFAVNLAAKKALNNLMIIKANFLLLSDLQVANSWQQVYLHFPDPVQKRKDEKRRIFTSEFLRLQSGSEKKNSLPKAPITSSPA